jgi:protein-S-isoprenylcysteine O-methyltransferase Ste14
VSDSAEQTAGVIAPPPLLFLGPLLGGLLLDRLLPMPRLPRPVRLAGLPLLAAGMSLAGWFLVTMRRGGTPVDPYEPSTALVVDGPFRHTRNPAYVGLTLFYAGVALLAGGRWPWLFLPGVIATIDRGVIQREERYLEERFGTEYREYRRQVRRWL